jgi:hypothetical protein
VEWKRENAMKTDSWRLTLFTLVIHLISFGVHADPGHGGVDYAKEIKPILKARCYSCHGALKQEAGLRLDSGRLIRQGGKDGAVITSGHAIGSLIERIRTTDSSQRMPPEGEPLSPEQVAKLIAWIEHGAESPDDEQPELDPRNHWSFVAPVRSLVPIVAESDAAKNPLDAFLVQTLHDHQLTPETSASKSVWLRRITLDLIGVPPTRQDLLVFLGDESPDAYEKVVDRLLSSPQYGERWGRHWMDVWRYADWFGRRYVPDVWNSAPQIWRWRDWIVKSLNGDKSYGRMVAEMLAADEISPEDDEAGHATGFLIRNWYALNPNDWMRSNVEHTGKAFLGLTFNCAHCHNHKYDPISQEDYFRFRAFFEPISIRQERVPGEADPGPFQEYSYSVLRKIVRLGEVRIFDKTPDAPTWFYTGGDERNRVNERGSIPAGLPAVLGGDSLKVEQVSLPPRAWYPGLRPGIHETILAEHRQALAAVESQLPAVRTAVETALPELLSKFDEAESEFERACQESRQAGRSGALSGQQSLLVDATTGRRVIQRRLQELKAVEDGSAIRFQLQILKDAHVNFQLAKDFVVGLTAAYIGFENGRIMSYQPGSFTEFEAGRYDYAAGQNRFEVTLLLHTASDQCLLSVRSISDNKLLVNNVPVARNGWNPVGDPTKGITFDVRTGAVAVIDDVLFSAPSGGDNTESSLIPLLRFDFEPPIYGDQEDVIGVDGWFGSSFSQPGATSIVSATIGDESLRPLSTKRKMARRALDSQTLKLKALEAKQAASVAMLESTNARIAADRAKYGETSGQNVDELARMATQRHLQTTVLAGEAEVYAKDQLLAAAEALPMDHPNRAKDIEAATQQLSSATAALEAARNALAEPTRTYPSFSPLYPSTSTGRRRALAEWIASRENPLTARVAINHIWLRHFHSPLVSSVYDFGRNGATPTHPELLDWLAVEFMESGWSMKHIHRLVVTSKAYSMSSKLDSSEHRALATDPENRFLWRMNAGRMESEVVRDSLLACAGRLDQRLGGQELENTQALTTWRRTIYYSCQPEIDGKSQFGSLFDAPEPADCYRRTRSIIPQQALALTNSDLIHEMSTLIAAELWQTVSASEPAQPENFVTAAFEQILTRAPTPPELAMCLEFLIPASTDEANAVRLRESLVRALLNHNDFVAIR